MTTPESKVKTEIRKFLTSHGIYWCNIQNGPGAKPGDPDLVLCLNGRFIGVEAKSPTGSLRPLQKVRMQEIEHSGGMYLVVHSLEELRIFLGL